MPACTIETVHWPTVLERARAGSCSSSSSSCSSGSELGSPSRPTSPVDLTPRPESIITRFLGWYPALVIRLTRHMITVTLYLLWNQIILSTGLWIVNCILYIPLSIGKLFLSVVYGSHGLGRTVLITGSSIETLQIARNFYRSGSRVIILEHDNDKYGLVHFSTVVDKFYKVPIPQKYPQDYIRELCLIAERENVTYFVPTSVSHPAHFDALAKPYLEQMGIKCMCPGVKEVMLMDDPAAMLQLCHEAGIVTPVNIRITTLEQLSSLYEEGQLRRARHVLFNAGPISVREVQKELELPQTRRGYRRLLQMQPQSLMNLSVSRPALVVQIPEGERLITCTTVREGRVVANITCRAPLPEEQSPQLDPVQRDDVDEFLNRFVSALPPSRIFTGHLTFTLILTRNGIVPINCRFGVALPYLCYTNQQPRMLMRPCKHHHHPCPIPDKGSLVLKNGCYWLHDTIFQTLHTPSLGHLYNLASTLIKKNEILFQTWDPLPSFIFYGLQIPARAAIKFIHRPHRTVSKHAVHFSTPECTPDASTTKIFKFPMLETSRNGLTNGYTNGHTVNGYVSSSNGHIPNGHISNGDVQNGYVRNDHEANSVGDLIQL